MKTIITFVLGIFAVAVISCASPPHQKLLSDYVPEFKGNYSPMKIPLQPSYKPAQMESTISSAVYIKLYGEEESFTEVDIAMKHGVSQVGDSLLWIADVKEYKSGSKVLKDRISLIRMKMLTDVYGNLKEYDISSPALEAERIRLKDGKQSYKEWLDSVREGIRRSSMIGNLLPENPIRTGDVFFKTPIADIVEPFLPLLAQTASEREEIKEWAANNPLQWILRGKTYHKDREVLLIICDTVLTYEKILSIEKADLSAKGYSLIDTDTCQTVFSEMVFSSSVTIGDDMILLRAQTTYLATFLGVK